MQWSDERYLNTITNKPLVELFLNNGTSLGFKEDYVSPGAASGSTDMGNVSYVCPSIHPFFSIGTNAANHTKDFTAAAGW